MGNGFTLLAFARDAAADAIERAARTLRIPLNVVRDDDRDERADYAARLVLVRPDQFVAWCGDDAPPDAALLLRKVTGT